MPLYFIITFLVFCLACTKPKEESKIPSQAPKPAGVEATIVQAQDLQESIQLPGTLYASEQVILRPEVSGVIRSIHFKDGQKIEKGNTLIQINDEELQARLQKLNIQKDVLSQQEQRQAQLLKSKAIGQSEYDNTNLQYRNCLADIQILQAEIKKYNLRAPFSGTLEFRRVSPGDYVSSSSIITTLTQTYPLKLRFSLSEQYVNRISMNQKIYFNCDNQSKIYSAIVNSVSPFLNPESKSMEILALVENNPEELKPGLFANIQFDLKNKPNSILIPSQCIIPRIKDKQVALYKSGKVQLTTVTVGYRDSSRVEIISGINIGDTVLTTGLMKLKPGASISINKLNNQ
jgi:membrane fusion protein (multidrug efflux system)